MSQCLTGGQSCLQHLTRCCTLFGQQCECLEQLDVQLFFLSTDLVGEEGNSLPVNLGTERRQVVRILRQHWKQMLDRPSHFPFGCFLEDAGESVTEKFSSLLTYTNHV